MTKPFRAFNQKGLMQNIIDALVDYICENDLKPGDKLPSQVEMARQLNVSRTSLREALAQLEAREVIKQVQGTGTFLASHPDEVRKVVCMETSITDMILALGAVPGTSALSAGWRKPPDELADCYPDESELICIERTRTADGVPFALSYAFLAPGLMQSPDEVAAHKHEESLHKFLEAYCDEFLTYFDDQIDIVFPDENMAAKLEIDTGQPIYKFVRHHYNRDKKLVVFSVDYYRNITLSIRTTRYKLFQQPKEESDL